MENEKETEVSFAEERLRLEREALSLERERLAAARAHVEAEARLSKARHPFLAVASVTLLALFCFLAGLLTGKMLEQNDLRRHREESLARALSQLDDLASAPSTSSATNTAASVQGTAARPAGGHRNVSVVVIQ